VWLTSLQTKARLLQNPEVQFNGSKLNPGTTGRWDLRNRKFFTPNTEKLVSWGICVVGGVVDKATVDNFVKVLVQSYVRINTLLLFETN
jgi:eukaryotic translation initiation factor 2C